MIACADQRGDHKPAASRLSREHDVRGVDATFQKGLVRRERVVDRCRVRVLRSESIVDGDDLGTHSPTDLRGQASGQEGVPDDVHATVEVENNVARLDSRDRDLGGRNAA